MGLIIVDFSDLLIHQSLKDIIGSFQYFYMTAEILLKNDQFPLARICLIKPKLIIENLGICLTKTIDGLFDIPHHKSIMAVR